MEFLYGVTPIFEYFDCLIIFISAIEVDLSEYVPPQCLMALTVGNPGRVTYPAVDIKKRRIVFTHFTKKISFKLNDVPFRAFMLFSIPIHLAQIIHCLVIITNGTV